MFYAHILKDESGYVVWYRYPTRFKDDEEEKHASGKIVATLFEESGDRALLDRRIDEWKKSRGIDKICGFEDISGASLVPTPEEYIEMLRKEAHNMVRYLEYERWEREKFSETILKLFRQTQEAHKQQVADLVDKIAMQETILEAAEQKGCGCVAEAHIEFNESIVWH